MQWNLLIGNILSTAGGCFTWAASLAGTRKWIYLHQVFQCLLLALASVFFVSWSGVVTFILCAARNLLLAMDRFDRKACVVFIAALLAIGLPANNLGLWGLIPVLASAAYTLGGVLARKEILMKVNMALELVLWLIYELHIMDFASAVIDGVTIVLTVVSMARALWGNAGERGLSPEKSVSRE